MIFRFDKAKKMFVRKFDLFLSLLLVSNLSLTFSFPGRKVNARIIGGNYAEVGQFPYQVAIMYDEDLLCGGSIIAPDVILTAAHCTYYMDEPPMSVIAGSNDISKPLGVKIGVTKFLIHPDYKPSNERNGYDVSLLFLKEPLVYGKNIQPIRLSDDFNFNKLATVSGFGKTGADISTTRLKYAEIPLWPVERSQLYFFYTDRLIFAGFDEKLDNSCEGDSGGPLVQNDKIIGIVSFGYGCGAVGLPKIFTSIPAMRNWIEENQEFNKK